VIGAGFLISPVYGQAPQAIKYQGVARDNVGNELTFQKLGLRLSIVADSATGTEVYVETHIDTTNEFGLFNVEIGNGITTDDFTAIDWGSTTHYLMVEMDETGGTSYQEMGTSQLLAVPYALYADSAGAAPGSAPQTLTFQAGGTLSISGGNAVALPDNVDDLDADTLNEIQTLTLVGNDLSITGGNTVTLPDSNDADADSTNEIQTLTLVGNDLSITGGNTVTLPDSNDADADSTNEIQTLTLSGNDLSITGGNTVTLSSTAPSDTSLYADSADFTNTAGYAWYADMAGYADTATYAWSAASSDTANFAYDADTATYAWSAASSDTANFAYDADTANFAWLAAAADSAYFAFDADTANYAWSALNADTANIAFAAGFANLAQNANYADTAKYADTAGYAFGPWGQSGTDIFYTPGKVGIGTSTPSHALEVESSGNGGMQIKSNLGGPWLYMDKASASNFSFIGFKEAGSDKWVVGNYADFATTATADDFRIIQWSNGSMDNTSFIIKSGGENRVGIGTSSPLGNLHVSGSQGLYVSSGSAGPRVVLYDEGDADMFVLRHNRGSDRFELNTASTTLMVVEKGGNVGIGTASPFFPLHAETSTADRTAYFINSTNTTSTTYGLYAGAFGAGSGDNIGAHFDVSGGTGINTALSAYATGGSAAWALYAIGNSFTSSGMWTPSDERLKTNISAFEGALSRIEQLSVKTYHFNTETFPTMNFSSRKQYGLMAQDLEKVFPEMVLEADHKIPGENGEMSEETVEIKAVNYVQLIPVLVKAVQEQQVIIESQKDELETLKVEMLEMKAAVRACSPKNK
jgi:hypothetical protein